MIARRQEGGNSGLIPVILHPFEFLGEIDDSWEKFHESAHGRTLSIGEKVVNTAWRDKHSLARFNAVTWKRKFWFGEPDAGKTLDNKDETIPEYRRKTILERLDGPNPAKHKLDDLNPPSPDKLILIYGGDAMIIPKGNCKVPKIDKIRRFRARRLLTKQLLISVCLMLSFRLHLAVIIAVSVWMVVFCLAWFLGGRMAKPEKSPDDNLFTRVSKSANAVELAARHLANTTKQSDDKRLAIDVILYYKDQVAWCRCQTRPSAQNTWIEVNIPSNLPFFDLLFRINELVINTFIPWGWMGDYKANRSLGYITLGLSAIHPLLGWLGLLLALVLKVAHKNPKSVWADGDTWIFSWYVCLLQSLTGVLRFKVIRDVLIRIRK